MRGGRVVVVAAATVTDAELVDPDTDVSVGAPAPVGASACIGVEVMAPTGVVVASGIPDDVDVDEDARG